MWRITWPVAIGRPKVLNKETCHNVESFERVGDRELFKLVIEVAETMIHLSFTGRGKCRSIKRH